MNKIKFAIVGAGNLSNTYAFDSPLTTLGWNGVFGFSTPVWCTRYPVIPHSCYNDIPENLAVSLGL